MSCVPEVIRGEKS